MAAASSSILLLLLAAFAAGANAATFTVINRCGFTVWPAAIPDGGGTQLDPDRTWTFVVSAGASRHIWGRTGCSFNDGGSGACQTGDCQGQISCTVNGSPPNTVASFSIGGDTDLYDISVVDGYNLPMAVSCSTGDSIVCTSSRCPQATRACAGNSNHEVTFCP